MPSSGSRFAETRAPVMRSAPAGPVSTNPHGRYAAMPDSDVVAPFQERKLGGDTSAREREPGCVSKSLTSRSGRSYGSARRRSVSTAAKKAALAAIAAARVRTTVVVNPGDLASERSARRTGLLPALAPDECGQHLALLVPAQLVGGIEIGVAQVA